MKKYIYGLFFALVSVAMFTACSEDEGSDIGSDSQAKATLYQYTATEPNDADIDTQIRIATNSATQSAYLLVEKTADYESRLTQLGEEGYKDYVVENGEKIEGAEGAANIDKTIKSLSGDNTIAVVAVGGGKSLLQYSLLPTVGLPLPKVLTISMVSVLSYLALPRLPPCR